MTEEPLPKNGTMVLLCTFCLLIAGGCGAGDGSGLAGPPPLAPTLESLQANILGPICAQAGCHRGAAAPLGLRLESAEFTVGSVVGIPSQERSDLGLARVSPGDTEGSYLVWKVEGRPGIDGERMPRNLPSLSEEELAAIREWILNGALP